MSWRSSAGLVERTAGALRFGGGVLDRALRGLRPLLGFGQRGLGVTQPLLGLPAPLLLRLAVRFRRGGLRLGRLRQGGVEAEAGRGQVLGERPALEQRLGLRVERRDTDGLERLLERGVGELPAPQVAADAVERRAALLDRRAQIGPLLPRDGLLLGLAQPPPDWTSARISEGSSRESSFRAAAATVGLGSAATAAASWGSSAFSSFARRFRAAVNSARGRP
ncbi:MAG: hypothetical protein ACYC1P_05950 [Gaiellaceae bacterium]